LISLTAICVPFSNTFAQSVDVSVDGRLGTGITIAASGKETSWTRTPSNLQFDAGLVFDEDEQFEWTLGAIIQLESQVAVALNPKLKLVRDLGATKAFASLGLPWFVIPVRRLGVEVGGGIIAPINETFSWVGNISIQAFFAGADVPDGQTVLVLNGAFGARIAF
jgi:hypothetical protein